MRVRLHHAHGGFEGVCTLRGASAASKITTSSRSKSRTSSYFLSYKPAAEADTRWHVADTQDQGLISGPSPGSDERGEGGYPIRMRSQDRADSRRTEPYAAGRAREVAGRQQRRGRTQVRAAGEDVRSVRSTPAGLALGSQDRLIGSCSFCSRFAHGRSETAQQRTARPGRPQSESPARAASFGTDQHDPNVPAQT